jgi:hypothetical protein
MKKIIENHFDEKEEGNSYAVRMLTWRVWDIRADIQKEPCTFPQNGNQFKNHFKKW